MAKCTFSSASVAFNATTIFAFDYKIKSVLADLMIPIEQRDYVLPHKCNSAEGGQGLLVDGFEKSGA